MGLFIVTAVYYQVQAQIFIADEEYCDFVVWTDKEVNIERIYPDVVFWKQTVTKASTFFSVSVTRACGEVVYTTCVYSIKRGRG